MKIRYIKNRITHNFYLGSFMIVAGNIMAFQDTSLGINILWIVAGSLQVYTVFYERKHQYISIQDGTLTRHSIFPKSIKIDEIRKIHKFINTYQIETSNKTLTINKNIIEAESMYRLDDYFKSLKVDATVTV
ncbi:hypothetical protein [Christiangramia sp. SM2212]|uniref:DUF304 domain-containing protein n=1 Tax=Christiangramia sediminicola TaxID=3073267 RepID=A0ABU1EL23_9FLAO|nr:hypothetical protein [Christiangramia sp. SM2212]MDR5589083.1 hypothetical protein [Christiangramia sp. SM2212]